jgi:glycosyltransferase involved in cell wall biosynthesis
MSNFLSSLAQLSDEKQGKKHLRLSSLKIIKDETSESRQPTTVQPAKQPDDLRKFRKYLRLLGLFDHNYYVATYPDICDANIDPFEHFFLHGYLEGRQPNAIFDPAWYLASYPEVKALNVQPLLHYAQFGEREGRRPSLYFDPVWYRTEYNIPPDQNALSHYLTHRMGPFSPLPEFDVKYYLNTYKDVADAKVDPFEHFMFQGYREGRNPSAEFDTRFYVQRYLKGKTDENPLAHYLKNRDKGGFHIRAPDNEATIPAEIKRFTKPGAHFEEFRPLPQSAKPRAKLLANYLTQFHATPDNDKWWGTGFTEWTNIARGIPRFKDHYQPRVPRDLGFYSLDHVEIMRRQAMLAKAAGVYGFIFYYYWFNGKRLLEKPLEQFLQTNDIDMPFCLMWANENWTRRWDGMEGEVLISQDYLGEDETALLNDYVRHFRDPRYIRLQGRPLLFIYRPRLIPDTAKTIAGWRDLFAERYGENPIAVMAQSFDDYDPRAYGMDGAIEFPPHKVTKELPNINRDVQCLDDTFSGQIYHFDHVVKYSLDEVIPEFALIKTAVPSWDNDARRQGTGLVIHGSAPAKYESWLSALIDRAQQQLFFGEPIVCINAWNEWCEGAYLEPDLHFGSAYLNATGRAVAGLTHDACHPKVLLVGHDAFPSGAQQLLLNIGKTMRTAFGVEIEFLLLAGGQLEDEYSAVAPLTILKGSLAEKIQELAERGFRAAIVNTTASGDAAAMLAERGIYTVLLVHELPRLLREKRLEDRARAGILGAHNVIFPATFVRDKVNVALGIPASEKMVVRPQGSYKHIAPIPEARLTVRRELGIPADSLLVIGVGYADMRKGFDLFLQLWRLARQSRLRVHFAWVGAIDPGLAEWLAEEIDEAKASGSFHMVGYCSDVNGFFSAADAFALTSREDPFPTVAIEAMAAGLPVFAFDGSGGVPELLKENALGYVMPHCDVPAMAAQLARVLARGSDEGMRRRAKEACDQRFAFVPYVRELLRIALPQLPSISVVVPNFNYAHCLRDRLNTIFDQTHPVEEIIILDDASTDDSIVAIENTAEEHNRNVTLVINEVNSGSVFTQWAKGAEMASAEFIWIAEADDLSEPPFLSRVIALMRTDPSIQLGFCDSRSIDAKGDLVYPSYKPYFATLEPGALTRTEVFSGEEFIIRFLVVKNSILNVSSVVWRRDALLGAFAACHKDLAQYRMAGDWRIYLECLAAPNAKIAYVADPLNVHRRHAQSVTHALKAQKHVEEIATIHAKIRERFKPPKSVLAAQSAYLEEVTTQLVDGAACRAEEPGRGGIKSGSRKPRRDETIEPRSEKRSERYQGVPNPAPSGSGLGLHHG